MDKPADDDAANPPSTQLVDSQEHWPTTDPRIDTVLADRYLVVKRLGQGGMARVYLARHQIIGRNVAIKILLPHLVDDALVVRRFVNEARAAGMIGHPNIVESLDIGTTDDGLPFLVLEYLEGTCLHDEVRRAGALPVERAIGIALQIASALGAAHAQGIIHRDLKSENVYLVERDGRADHVKVLDFGISKFAEGAGDQKRFTAQGSVMGTPECMAPEQFIDPDGLDARIDVYALGVLLYELLAGRTPFSGIPFPKVMYSIVNDDPAPLVLARPGEVSPELDAVVRRAMAKSRDDRPKTMDELYDSLLPFAGKAPPPRFQARKSTPDGQVPMTYRLPPRGGGSTPGKPSTPNDSGARTLVSGPVRIRPAASPPRAEVAVAQPDARSTESATSAPPAQHAPSRASLYIALAIVLLGAPATYLVLRGAGKSSNEGATTSSTGGVASTSTLPSMSSPSNPTSAPSSAPPSVPPSVSVPLAVICPLPDARMTFRGRTSALPFTDIVAPGTQLEPIEVTAEGHEGRRYFVRVDHAMSLAAKLPPGKAIVVDATAAETSAALAGGTPEVAKPPNVAPSVSNAPTASSKPNVDITLDR